MARDTGDLDRTRAWTLPLAAWIVGLLLMTLWLTRTPLDALREQLKTLQFWSLEACVALALALGVAIVRELSRELQRRDVLSMAALAAVGLALTLAVAPRTNRIFYDEQIYQGIGQNLSDLKLAQMCNDGTVEYGRLQCWRGEYNKQPYAYPHLLSLAYRLAGVHAAAGFVLNAVVMAATVAAVYLLTWLLFADRTAALFAGLLLALTPQQLVWSATAAVEPAASLACVAALVAVAHASRVGSTVSLAGAGVFIAYAIQFRPESPLILGAAAVLFWSRSADAFARPRTWWIGLLTLALVAVPLAHMVLVRNEGWGTTGARLSLDYVVANFRTNGPFFVADERFPAAYTLLALIGLGVRGRRGERAAMLLYFLAFFGIGLVFYAGSYDYGADVRYSLMTYPPIAVLGGAGALRVSQWVARRFPALRPQPAVTAALVFQFLWYAPLVRATTEEAWAARADVRFAEAFAPDLPANSYVLTHNPSMFHVWGVNAGQLALAAGNPIHIDYLAMRFAGGIYVHWNYWCNVADPIQREVCRTALDAVPSTTVREYRERDQRYALYRLTVRPPR